LNPIVGAAPEDIKGGLLRGAVRFQRFAHRIEGHLEIAGGRFQIVLGPEGIEDDLPGQVLPPIQEEEEEKLQRLFPLPLLAADFFLAPPEPEVAQGLHLEGVAGVVFQPRQAVLGQKALEKEIVLELLARIQKEGSHHVAISKAKQGGYLEQDLRLFLQLGAEDLLQELCIPFRRSGGALCRLLDRPRDCTSTPQL